jgi:Hemerythrin HHE cation binding domain
MVAASRRRPPRALLLVAAASVVVATRRVRRRRQQARDDEHPADLGFMRAIHAGLRRDAARLQAIAPQLDRPAAEAAATPPGWVTFRQVLHVHHGAEDDDLWPLLRRHLTDQADLHQVDLMVAEHRDLTAAIDTVQQALTSGAGVTAAAGELGAVLGGHLDHEEQHVFPLLERHLSRREWRGFLRTERRRRPPRQRPEFLTWVLEDASEQDAAAVLAELPRPAHLAYRLVLRPRYDAQRRWQPV